MPADPIAPDGRSRPLLARVPVLGALPGGTVAVGVGLGVLGLASYGFLGIAARALDAKKFAELSVVWTMLFTLGPGLFAPLEQEVGRHLAAVPGRPLLVRTVRRAAFIGAGAALVLTLVTLAAAPFVLNRLLDGDVGLFLAAIGADAALFAVHVSRGVLAGTDRFGRYGAQLSIDGLLRVGGAAVLAAFAVGATGWYGAVLIVSQLVAVALSVVRLRAPRTPTDGADHEASWRALLHGLGWMAVATMSSQVLANAGTLIVKAFADPGDPVAGRFLTALVLARVPLFLFAALQASLLPRLAALLAAGEAHRARRMTLAIVAALAAIGGSVTLLMALAGPQISQLLFGPGYGGQRLLLTLLSLAATVYMVGAAMAQSLLAMRATRLVALGWLVGVAAAALALAVPADVSTRVSVSFLAGSVVSAVVFGVALRARLSAAAAATPAAVA